MFNPKTASLGLLLAGLSGAAFAADHPAHIQSGAFDLAVADPDKVIKMLQQSGKIAANASYHEAHEALRVYLKDRQEKERKKAGNVDFDIAAKFKRPSVKGLTGALQNGKGNKLGIAKQDVPAPLSPEAWNGETKTAKVLAILMEFPDFGRTNIEPGETGMYYEEYTAEHYSRILFGENGWVAPNGLRANSMAQYYLAQSGGSYTVEGSIAGWYTASKPAAYYGNNDNGDIRSLVREGLAAASLDPNVNLADFDVEDRYDLDGDGDLWEPDGLVDHVMIFHSSIGEEAGGGKLGVDAIWAHRWNLGGVFGIPGSSTPVPYWGGAMGAYDYTVQPIDSAVGVVTHEYGHDLGLPDEYDTEYSGRGEPVSFWSIMSNGIWSGEIGGTEPVGFSAWSKEFLQGAMGGNWLHGATVHLDDIPADGLTGLLDQAVDKGSNNDAIRIDLPAKETIVAEPTSGEYVYFSGSDNSLFNRMATIVDLSTAADAKATFKAWYDIETDWDYAYVYVISSQGVTFLKGNITTDTNPNGQNRGNAITGQSGGWVDAEFDLSAFAGEVVQLTFLYETDAYEVNPGLYVDDFAIVVDGNVTASANAEGDSDIFGFAGFSKNNGVTYSDHYYLLEWRTHKGIDHGLSQVHVAGQPMPFNEGLIVWYVDNKYTNNWVGIHPGEGFVGVVDADQHVNKWNDGAVGSTRYQVRDAAFGLDKTDKMLLDFKARWDIVMRDNFTQRNTLFDDANNFISIEIPDAGRNIPKYGLKVRVTGQSDDKTVGRVFIFK